MTRSTNMEHVEVLRQAIAELRQGSIPALRRTTQNGTRTTCRYEVLEDLIAKFPESMKYSKLYTERAGSEVTPQGETIPSHPRVTYENFRITAPIFVARQFDKHQVHLVKSEVSRRYVKDAPELYWPKEWHYAPKNLKQGASDEAYPSEGMIPDILCARQLVEYYNQNVQYGLAPEEARMFLPQNMYTEWIWTGSVEAFSRVCRERLAKPAQGATRDLAAMIDEEMEHKYGSRWNIYQS